MLSGVGYEGIPKGVYRRRSEGSNRDDATLHEDYDNYQILVLANLLDYNPLEKECQLYFSDFFLVLFCESIHKRC